LYTITPLDVARHYDPELLSDYEDFEVGSGRTALVLDNGESVIKIFKDSFDIPDELREYLAVHDIETALDYAIENELHDELVFGLIEIKNLLLVAEAKSQSGVVPRVPGLIAIAVVDDTDSDDQYLALELDKVTGKPLARKLEDLHAQIRRSRRRPSRQKKLFDELKTIALAMQDLADTLDFLSSNGLIDLDLNLTNILIDYDEDEGIYQMTKIDLGSIRPQMMWGSGIEYTGSAQYLPWGEYSSDYLESLWFKDFRHKSSITNSLHQHAFARIYYEILSGDNLSVSSDTLRLTLQGNRMQRRGVKHPLINRFQYFEQVLNAANFDVGMKFLNCRVLDALLYIGLVEDKDIFTYTDTLVQYSLLHRLPYTDTHQWLDGRYQSKLVGMPGDILKRIWDILGLFGRPNMDEIMDLLLRNEFGARVDDDQAKAVDS
jgi:hypothetical protein